MKITQQTADSFVAQENNYSFLLVPVVLLIFGLLFAFSTSSSSTGSQSSPWIGYILLGLAVVSLLFWKRLTIQIDKASHQVTIVSRYLTTQKQKQYDTSQVQSVQLATSVRSQTNSSGRSSTSTTYSLLLILNDGTSIDLSDVSRQGNGLFSLFHSAPNQQIGQAIASFLGIPFNELTPNSAAQMFATVAKTLVEHPSQPNGEPMNPQAMVQEVQQIAQGNQTPPPQNPV